MRFKNREPDCNMQWKTITDFWTWKKKKQDYIFSLDSLKVSDLWGHRGTCGCSRSERHEGSVSLRDLKNM